MVRISSARWRDSMQQGLKRRQLKGEHGDSIKRQDTHELLREDKPTNDKVIFVCIIIILYKAFILQSGSHGGRFDIDLWFLLTLECWLFDFGRPIYALYVSNYFPLSLPSIG